MTFSFYDLGSFTPYGFNPGASEFEIDGKDMSGEELHTLLEALEFVIHVLKDQIEEARKYGHTVS